MRRLRNRILGSVVALGMASVVGFAQAADNYFFRLRPSVSILNQDPFSIRIDGDRAGVVGSTFRAKAEASASRETLRFSVSGGDLLPPGIGLDETSGTISGTPKARGRFMTMLVAQDAFSSASAPLTITVYDPIEIDSTLSQYAMVGKPYSASFQGKGGDGSFNWTLTGNLPAGLNFGSQSAPTTTISGTPTLPGSWGALRVSVADGSDHAASGLPFSITVADELKIVGNPVLIGTVGQSYATTFASTGGHNPITWSLNRNLGGIGLSFSNGAISGTPTKAETVTGLVVSVTDVASNTVASAPFTIAVSQPLELSGTPLGVATVGLGYAASFTASGGNGNYLWSKTGTLPTGMTFAAGAISGAPTVAGTWSDIVIGVTDGNGRVAQSVPFTVVVSQPLAVSGTPSKTATVAEAYSAAFSASGGDGNYSWTIASGTLPDGLTLSNGTVSGMPTTPGTSGDIVLRVTDGNGRTAQSAPFKIAVSQPLALVGSSPAVGTVGVGYTANYTASGGAGSKAWSIANGSLPAGLTLVNGAISGTPTTKGTASGIVILVTDADGRTARTEAFSISVHDALTIAGSTPNMGTFGSSYSGGFSTAGGDGNYAWSVTSGSLPNGLSLSSGTISGTPSAASTFANIIVRVSDGSGRSVQSPPFSIVIYNQMSISGAFAGSGLVGRSYNSTVTASGGRGTYAWTIVSGTLPTGLTLSNGTISGTPTGVSTWGSIVIRATDLDGRTAQTGAFSIAIASPVTAGSVAYTTPGVYYFTVPAYNSLTADVRGAGGGGGGYTTIDFFAAPPRSADGGYSYFNAPTGNLVGYGGQGGEYGFVGDDFYTGANGAHGSGVNGDYNGYADGAGGGAPASQMYVPAWRGGYGGNGARAYRTWYANGPLVPGSVIQIVVGTGGARGEVIHYQPQYGYVASGGGNGAVYLSWQ
jgi:hypothetical protein